ncbi:hypothetical protein CRUP_006531 [Coryphaenoides rupestris]|nr:hypothetical protein CRUP_006531 [Coryphaenoides rupestris]
MPVSKARERLMLRALHRYGPPGGGHRGLHARLAQPAPRHEVDVVRCPLRVWNEAVAHRLATLGHAPRQGDLVWQQQQQQDTGQEDAGESNLRQIHVVSAEEEEAGVYTLAQV